MSDTGRKINLKRAAKLLSLIIASVLCVILLLVIVLKIYLATALPAPQLSRFVTSYLQQNFTVQRLRLSGGTLVLKGVRLENPAGFRSGNLVAADAVAIAPEWFDLLLGRQRFQLISIDGGKLNLEKNSSGAWNFSTLLQHLAAKKPRKPPTKRPVAESFIEKLLVQDGEVSIQGERVKGIALQIFNLTSRGTRNAQVELAFEDAARNRYSLRGTARPGKDAAVDLSLTAPSLSLQHLAALPKLKNARLLQGAQGALQANAVLNKGNLRSSGIFSFSRVQLPGAKADHPVAGTLNFEADYNMQADTARLRAASLTVDNLARLHADGSVKGVKNERDFALRVDMDQVDLAMLNVLMSDEARGHLLFGGRLRCDSLRLEGNGGKGLKSAAGTLQLRDGSLAREGELIVDGLSGSVGFTGKDGAVVARGRLAAPRSDRKALVEALDLPFDLTLSSKLKPLRAESAALSARVTGVPIAGRIAYNATSRDPLSASLRVPAVSAATLDPLLRRYDLRAASGTTSGTLELRGKSAQDLSGSARLQLSNFKGSRGKDSLGVKKGAVTAKVLKRGGRLQAQGDARFSLLAFNGKAGDARFAYRVVDRMIYLEGVQVALAASRLSISRLSARMPAVERAAKTSRYPLVVDMDGVAIKQGELELGNLSGRVRGSFAAEGGEKWLEGTADVTSRAVSWQGTGVAAPVLHVTFSRSGGRGDLTGRLLGGKLAGEAAFKPFAAEAGATFQLGVKGAVVAQAARFLPESAGMRPTGGLVDLHLTGGYSSRDGLSCRFESKGSGISLADRRGKALVSGAAVSLAGGLSGGTLSISEASLSPGKGVALRLKGDIARAFSPKRHGALVFSLPETSVDDMVESLISVAPRMVQEATFDGRIAADGKIELREGLRLLEGGLTVKGGRLEVAPQKLVVAEIDGRLPFSLDLSGKQGGQPRIGREFSRENYPRLLAQLRDDAGGGEVVSVGKITFGTLEMGKLTMRIRAANGLTEISSLRTTLYEGAVLGTGYLTMRDKFTYRGDLLINGLSMRTLCRTVPNLQGYISGRVDGVISLSGGDGGIAGTTGFVDLWAREGGGEKMLVSKEFLQRLAKQKLSGFFLSTDRAYDEAEIKATLEEGDLTFNALKIVNTNLFGVRDLNVSIAPTQNRIALDHLLSSIKEAAVRGQPATGERPPDKAPVKPEITPEFKWED